MFLLSALAFQGGREFIRKAQARPVSFPVNREGMFFPLIHRDPVGREFLEFVALRTLVRGAVVGGGVGVQRHGVRMDGQDVVGRDAGTVLEGLDPGFVGSSSGRGSTLFPAGAQMREVSLCFLSGEVIV